MLLHTRKLAPSINHLCCSTAVPKVRGQASTKNAASKSTSITSTSLGLGFKQNSVYKRYQVITASHASKAYEMSTKHRSKGFTKLQLFSKNKPEQAE
jgi:hypothetical protein